jgi:septum formation protein
VGKYDMVLASNSPRRRDLLALSSWKFQVRPAEVDEKQIPDEAAEAYVLRLAQAKAKACADSSDDIPTILAADTAVIEGNNILGKPEDAAEAREMLLRLRGRTHQVYTGIALLRVSDGYLVTDLCITDVPMRIYSDKEMETYIKSGDPFDKAGGYAIQHSQFHPVESMQGCYASVMGLPLCHLERSLQKMGLTQLNDIPGDCQAYLGYTCPIFAEVLRGKLVG